MKQQSRCTRHIANLHPGDLAHSSPGNMRRGGGGGGGGGRGGKI
jgi:hypothetical protein